MWPRMSKRAVITGITGQDGSYLAELLLEKGYEVVGVVRRTSAPNLWRIEHLLDRMTLKPADLLDQLSLVRLLSEIAAARALQPRGDVVRAGLVGSADADRRVQRAGRHAGARGDPSGRLRRSASIRRRRARCSARSAKCRRRELTPFYPRSPYGVSKVFGHYITVNYRESYGLFACSGILFNHESPRRGLEFVTRKVTDGVARIKLGLAETLSLGNLDAQRDWGFAGDYVRAMWLMLQQPAPTTTSSPPAMSHSVRDLVEIAFGHVGLDWQRHVRLDPNLIRPAEVDHLIGDATKARRCWAGRRR